MVVSICTRMGKIKESNITSDGKKVEHLGRSHIAGRSTNLCKKLLEGIF